MDMRLAFLGAGNFGILTSLLAQTDSLSGGAGWVGAGLLGLVLSWVFLVHLPALSKTLKELLEAGAEERKAMTDRYDVERTTERQARHERANEFQKVLTNLTVVFKQEIKDIEQQHRVDALADREAFMQRNIRLEEAIKAQTLELRTVLQEAVRGMCHYTHQAKP